MTSNEPVTQEITPEERIAQATAKLEQARAAQVDAVAKLQEAAKSKDVRTMVAASDAVKVADRNLSNAESVYRTATFELRARERDEVSLVIRRDVEELIGSLNVEQIRELGITGLSVIFSSDGPIISINHNAPAARKATTSRTRQPGEGVVRTAWHLNGQPYTSRELLLTFATEPSDVPGFTKGELAVAQSEPEGEQGWKTRGLKAGPGFDAHVKRLAAKMGWNGEADRILTHIPE